MREAIRRPARVAAADLQEYHRRLGAVRTLMANNRLDAIVATDDHRVLGLAPGAPKPQPPYARYLSNFHIPSQLHPHRTSVVVPLDGQPVLVVPPGIRRSFVELALAHSWIEAVSDTYVPDPEWEARTRWGWLGGDLAKGIADALRTSGLERARIGIAGDQADFDSLRTELPEAAFVDTLTKAPDGTTTDALAPLLASNSQWEVDKLTTAHAGADAMKREFIKAARAGGAVREARAAAQAAGTRAGVDEMIMFGSVGVDPFTYWDWSFPVEDHFQAGRLYFFQAAVASAGGYEVQSARSFVIGQPTDAQLRLADTMERALRKIYSAIAVGVTGADLYQLGIAVVTSAGYELWGQLGHSMGFKAHASPRGLALLPGNQHRLAASEAMVVHTCVLDAQAGTAGMAGDTLLVESAGARVLSARPLGYGLDGE
jgi:Xaa-Pro aminopeptidase